MSVQGSERWIRELCQTGASFDWKGLEHRLIAAHRRDRSGLHAGQVSGEIDGFKASHAMTGGGGGASILVKPSDDPEVTNPDGESVAVTAVEAAMFGMADQRDSHHDHFEQARAFAADSVRAAQAAKNRLDRIDKDSDPDHVEKQGPAVCAQPHCEDPSDNKRGQCKPCYRYELRHEEYPGAGCIVPAPVIELRVATRESNKVHVTGPDAVSVEQLTEATT